MSFQIAMDGPVAAGKGTVARLTAQRLNLLYVDTGAMYRVTALIALQKNIPFEHEDELVEAIQQSTIEMTNPTEKEKDGRLTTVRLNGEDVSWKIRTEKVGQGSSKVAVLKKVRQELVKKQQQIASSQDVVMEGRDITFRVLPNAQIKIFLTASDETRAKRRLVELQSKGQDVTFQAVYNDLIERDKRDMERAVDPLHITEDAWVIDTSDLSIDEVVNLIVTKAKELHHV